jgi:hypothetical protein
VDLFPNRSDSVTLSLDHGSSKFITECSNVKSLGRNPLNDAPYRNLGMVLNGQGPGRHPLSDAPYLDLDTVLNE